MKEEFEKWLKENDIPEKAEEFFGYTDKDMYNYFLKEYKLKHIKWYEKYEDPEDCLFDY
jgi:hypothetical protein